MIGVKAGVGVKAGAAWRAPAHTHKSTLGFLIGSDSTTSVGVLVLGARVLAAFEARQFARGRKGYDTYRSKREQGYLNPLRALEDAVGPPAISKRRLAFEIVRPERDTALSSYNQIPVALMPFLPIGAELIGVRGANGVGSFFALRGQDQLKAAAEAARLELLACDRWIKAAPARGAGCDGYERAARGRHVLSWLAKGRCTFGGYALRDCHVYDCWGQFPDAVWR